jgi:hypothetical protein
MPFLVHVEPGPLTFVVMKVPKTGLIRLVSRECVNAGGGVA